MSHLLVDKNATDADIVLTVKCGEQLLTTIGGIRVLVQCDANDDGGPVPKDEEVPDAPRFPDDREVDIVDMLGDVPDVDLPKFDADKVAYINVGSLIDRLAAERGINVVGSSCAVNFHGVGSLSVHGHDVSSSALRDLLSQTAD